jgi:hypothetical protein
VVSWKPPSSTGGSPITGYVITASPGGKTVRTAKVTSYLVGGLVNGTAYQFTVAAVNKTGAGPESSPSAAVTTAPPAVPGPARAVLAVAGFQEVVVSWTAPQSDGGTPVTGYKVTTSPATSAVTVSGDARSATVAGLSDGTAYRVVVATVNSVGAAKPARSALVTPQVTVPDAPAEVAAEPTASGVKLSWQPPLSDGGSAVTGYVIGVVGTSRTLTAGPGATSVTVTGLSSGSAHTFTVAAVNAVGQGGTMVSPPATVGGTVGSATVVLSKSSLSALTQVQTDRTLVFTSPPAQVKNLAQGDVIVAGISTAAPNGLLAKVNAVSTNGSTVTVSTTPAGLDDALSAGGFGVNATLTTGQVAKFIPARPGVRLLAADQAPASAPPGSISLGLHTVLYTSSDGRKVTVSGTISLSPSTSFSASIKCCFHVTSKFTGTITASAQLSVNAQVSHDMTGDYSVGDFDLTDIPIDVLGVPVVLTPNISVDLTADGSVTAGLTAAAGQSLTVGAQVSSSDSHITATPVYSHTTTWAPPTLYGTFSAKAGVESAFTVKIDDLPGPGITNTTWVAELTADTSKNPWWTLTAEDEVDVGYDLSQFDSSFPDLEEQVLDVVVPLTQALDPYQAITITPDPAVTTPGGTLQLHAKVAGAAAQNVTWSVPAGNGSITQTGLYTAPGTRGTYQVIAAQPGTGLNPGAEGLLSVQVGNQPPGPPTNPAASSTSYGTATVTWAPPADTGGAAITSYTVTASPGGQSQQTSGTTTSDTISGLTPGATYTFTIKATTDGGSSVPSPATNAVQVDDSTNGAFVFDGSPGTGPPPAALGPYSMTPFGPDSQPDGGVRSVNGPTGAIAFSPTGLNHEQVGTPGWASWSNGYTGDIYYTSGESAGQNTITLPANTVAFYFYAQPGYDSATITATAQDGTTSGPIEVTANGGAKYFGFYATGSAPLTTINIVANPYIQFAIGEFGIAAGTAG